MDDRRAALILAALALAGAGVRFALSPAPDAPPGQVELVAPTDTPPLADPRDVAHRALKLARPLQPGERVDLNTADVTEITRLPRVGPALAQRIVDWREKHGLFASIAALDSVPGVGPKLLDALRPHISFSGIVPDAP